MHCMKYSLWIASVIMHRYRIAATATRAVLWSVVGALQRTPPAHGCSACLLKGANCLGVARRVELQEGEYKPTISPSFSPMFCLRLRATGNVCVAHANSIRICVAPESPHRFDATHFST